jgi:hypothetical protein
MSKVLDNIKVLESVTILDTAQSTSTSTGAIKIAGGLGIGKNITIGENISFNGKITGKVRTTAISTSLDEDNILTVIAVATITLPNITDPTYNGVTYTISKDVGVFTVTVESFGALSNIFYAGGSVATFGMSNSLGEQIRIVSNGTKWYVMDSNTSNAPGTASSIVATGGVEQASVAFDVPASDGGSAIILYTVKSTPDGYTGSGISSPVIVTGLTGGTAYTFKVTAINKSGIGAESAASNSVTIQARLLANQNDADPVAVAVFGGELGFSLDGRDFMTDATAGFGGNGKVAYNGVGRFVSVSPVNSTIVYSDNGIKWNILFTPLAGLNYAHDVAYGNGIWVIVGQSSTAGDAIRYSTDNAITWLVATTPALFSTNMIGVAFDGVGKWIAHTNQQAVTSTDGITWTLLAITSNMVAHDGDGTWVSMANQISVSTDGGNNWVIIAPIPGDGNPIVALAHDSVNDRWVCSNGQVGQTMFWSDDLINWNSVTYPQFGSKTVKDIAHNGIDQWTANANGVIVYSVDGEVWLEGLVGGSIGTGIAYARLLP